MVSPGAGSETAEASEPRAGGARMSEGRSFVGTFSSVRSYLAREWWSVRLVTFRNCDQTSSTSCTATTSPLVFADLPRELPRVWTVHVVSRLV